MIKITLPTDVDTMRSLKIGDSVSISGVMVMGRDEVHKHLFNKYDKKAAKILNGSFIYHCGPIIKSVRDKYEMICCGPTTSAREEPYQADIVERYGLRGVIGKGGMGGSTLSALEKNGAVYLQAPGGAAAPSSFPLDSATHPLSRVCKEY